MDQNNSKPQHGFAERQAKAAQANVDGGIYSSIIVPLLAGGAATAIGDLAVHPMDTLKTLQQA